MPSSSPDLRACIARRARRFITLLLLAVWSSLFTAPVSANEPDWFQRDSVQHFIDEVSARHGFDRLDLSRLIRQAQPSQTVLRLVAPPAPGFKRSWSVYRKRFIEPVRIRAGLKFWETHVAALTQAESRFGVPAAIIVSIIGIETLYGQRMGDFRVLDALTTLAFEDPRRAAYFQEELEQFLLLARESGQDPLAMRGSFAGAIGIPQFMPGSVRRHGLDFDGDGRIDLRASPRDAIGSVANFLRKHGWQPGEPTHHPVKLEDEVLAAPAVALGIPPRLIAAELSEYGLSTSAPLPGNQRLILVDLPDGDDPTHYLLGTENFHAITIYNRSYFYAMAVIDFAQVLSQERQKARKRVAAQPGKRSIDR